MDAIFSTIFWLLAQGEGAPGGSPFISILTLGLPMVIFFWLLFIRPQQKEQAKMAKMLADIKKNDHVVTVGGIHGVVANVHREVGEVTIRVDETTNTKLRMTLGAIARILADNDSNDSSK